MGAIKTLESFEGLLDRPAVAVVVRKCGAALMSDLTLDLRRVCLYIFANFFARLALHCCCHECCHCLSISRNPGFFFAFETESNFSSLLTFASLWLMTCSQRCTAQVAHMFRSEKDNPPLLRNAAPYSGAVTWLRSLRSRIMG